MVNVALTDLLLSLGGVQRGLAIISPDLMIAGPSVTPYCTMFAVLMNFVGYVT